jgi:hypothetical protein
MSDTRTKPKPLSEDLAWALFIALDHAGFVSGISKSIWGSKDAKRWEVRATPTESLPLPPGFREPDRWDDGTAIWGARR